MCGLFKTFFSDLQTTITLQSVGELLQIDRPGAIAVEELECPAEFRRTGGKPSTDLVADHLLSGLDRDSTDRGQHRFIYFCPFPKILQKLLLFGCGATVFFSVVCQKRIPRR